MNDEKTSEQTDENPSSLAQEWLKPHAGRPPKSIAPLVKKISKKGIELEEAASNKIKREEARDERIRRNREVAKAKALQRDITRAQKTEEFLKAFIETDGNLTQTGLKVFNTDNKQTAASMAGSYLKANQMFMRQFLEKKGYTLGWMLELLAKKAMEGRSADFIDRLFRIAGYGELQPPKYVPPTVININQTQKKLASDYGFEEGEIVDGDTENTTQKI